MGASKTRRVPTWAFAVTMAAGLGLVMVGLSRADEATRTGDAVATVNGVPIGAEQLLRQLEVGPGGGFDEAKAQRSLDDLIVEEAIYQRATGLGLARNDAMVRRRLVQIVRELATNDAKASEPSEEVLRSFYQQNLPLFPGPDQYRVAEIFLADPGKKRRGEVRALTQRLSEGESFSQSSKQTPIRRLTSCSASSSGSTSSRNDSVRPTAAPCAAPTLESTVLRSLRPTAITSCNHSRNRVARPSHLSRCVQGY